MTTPVCLKAVTDVEKIQELDFEVSNFLTEMLDEQRSKLNQIDAKLPGKERARAARAAGCLCSVAKGVSQRKLSPAVIFIPASEISHVNGGIRISSFKTTIAGIPSDAKIKGVKFYSRDGFWSGNVEVLA
jgi:hypothetical protein